MFLRSLYTLAASDHTQFKLLIYPLEQNKEVLSSMKAFEFQANIGNIE